MWLCLKMGSESMVLVRLLQIGAKDLTVPHIVEWAHVNMCGHLLKLILDCGTGEVLS